MPINSTSTARARSQSGGLIDAFVSPLEEAGEKVNIIAPGFAEGHVVVIRQNQSTSVRNRITDKHIDSNLAKYQKAMEAVRTHLEATIQKASQNSDNPEHANVLATQLEITNNLTLDKLVRTYITDFHACASFAVEQAIDYICSLNSGITTETDRLLYDWNSVKDLLQQSLSGEISSPISALDKPCIIVHPNPSLTDIYTADKENILGWVVGSTTAASHVRIILRDSKVPVVALEEIDSIKSGDYVATDFLHRRILINPSDAELSDFRQLQGAVKSGDESSSLTRIAPVSACGASIIILGTLNTADGIENLIKAGVTHVGLTRTENLFFLGRKKPQWPNEDEQTQQLIDIARTFLPGKLTVRTFDVGGDKLLGELPGESESKLGLKSVRLALSAPEMFGSHLSAIIRAQSEVKNIYPIFPMISDLGELLDCQELLQERAEILLSEKKISRIPPLQIGAMIENPAGVCEIRKILTVADFISIGWSDLTQYYMAADRDVQAVSHSYTPHHPAVLKAMLEVVTAANEAGKPVSICGEIISHRTYLPIALGLGVCRITVAADAVAKLNGKLQELYVEECKELVARMISAATPAEAGSMLSNFHRRNFISS